MERINLKKLTLVAVTSMVMVFAGTSYASNNEILNSASPGDNVTFDYNGSTYEGGNQYTGGIQGTLNNAPTTFFCFDLAHQISLNTSYTTTSTAPSVSVDNGSNTYSQQVAATLLNHINLSALPSGNVGTVGDMYAGLQMAIWNILYNWSSTSHTVGTSLGTSASGSVFFYNTSGNVLTDALADLTYAVNMGYTNSANFNTGGWTMQVVSGSQTLICNVPEPETYMLLGGFLAFGIFARQKKKVLQNA